MSTINYQSRFTEVWYRSILPVRQVRLLPLALLIVFGQVISLFTFQNCISEKNYCQTSMSSAAFRWAQVQTTTSGHIFLAEWKETQKHDLMGKFTNLNSLLKGQPLPTLQNDSLETSFSQIPRLVSILLIQKPEHKQKTSDNTYACITYHSKVQRAHWKQNRSPQV